MKKSSSKPKTSHFRLPSPHTTAVMSRGMFWGRDVTNKWVSIKHETGPVLKDTHQDVFDAIMAVGRKMPTVAGDMAVLFKPREILKTLGHKNKNNYKWLFLKLDEMQTSLFVVSYKRKTGTHNSKVALIMRQKWAESDKPGGGTGKIGHGALKKEGKKSLTERIDGEIFTFYGVQFSKEFMDFFRKDLGVNYEKHIPYILSLPRPVKRFARFIITNETTNFNLFKLSQKLEGDEREARRARKAILLKSQELYDKLGIEIKKVGSAKDYTVNYKQAHGIFIVSPNAKKNRTNLIREADKFNT